MCTLLAWGTLILPSHCLGLPPRHYRPRHPPAFIIATISSTAIVAPAVGFAVVIAANEAKWIARRSGPYPRHTQLARCLCDA